MDLFRPIDIYCERLGPNFWAEPINALTNASFIFAALAGYLLIKAHPDIKYRGWLRLMCILTFVIGVGSFCFHTFANVWSQFADILPIFLLKITFVFFSLKYIFRLGVTSIVFFLVLFMALTLGFGFPPIKSILNGSMTYVPTLAFMFILSFGLKRRGLNLPAKLCILAAALFTTAVTARSIDMAICSYLNIGTHFIWHSINGLVIYLIIYTIFEFAKSESK